MRRMDDHWARRPLALAASAAVLVLTALAVVAAVASGVGWDALVEGFVVSSTALGLCQALPGLVIARYRSDNRVGWLLIAAGVGFLTSAAGYALLAWLAEPGSRTPLWRVIADLTSIGWPLAVSVFVPLAVLLFPNGHLPGRGWRWVLPVALLGGLGAIAAFSLGPADTTSPIGVQGYLRWPALDGIEGMEDNAPLPVLVVYMAGVVSLAVRYRRGDPTTRRQLLWVLLAALLMVTAMIVDALLGLESWLGILVIALPPIAIAIAIVAHQLFDIQLVVSRFVLYLLLTVLAVGTYVAVVALGERTLSERLPLGPPVIAAVLIALAFNPARAWLQERIDRLFYGSGRDPARAIAEIGARIGQVGVGQPGSLDQVLASLCSSLRLPGAQLLVADGIIATYGQAPEQCHRIPLELGGEVVGALVVSPRRGESRLGARDRRLLEQLGTSLAVTVQAVQYAEELQSAREALVGAREEERRRLHHDLHDGLGPVLAGVQLTADAARRTVQTDPEAAAALMDDVRRQSTTAIAEVRRLARGMRPPTLDSLGLVSALEQQAATLAPLEVIVQCRSPLPDLPPAVDVAVYRIATEALTNIVRHAPSATCATVALGSAAGSLTVSITDNAGNGQRPWEPGVGLVSMRKRALEVGGTFDAGPHHEGGRVFATLPFREVGT